MIHKDETPPMRLEEFAQVAEHALLPLQLHLMQHVHHYHAIERRQIYWLHVICSNTVDVYCWRAPGQITPHLLEGALALLHNIDFSVGAHELGERNRKLARIRANDGPDTARTQDSRREEVGFATHSQPLFRSHARAGMRRAAPGEPAGDISISTCEAERAEHRLEDTRIDLSEGRRAGS